MEWFNIFRTRLRALFRRESVLLDVEEELRIHIEMETDDVFEGQRWGQTFQINVGITSRFINSIVCRRRVPELIRQRCYQYSRWVQTSPGLIANSAYSGRYLWMVADWH